MKELSTKCSRGTSSMARSTAASLMPRLRKASRNCMRPTLSSPGGCLGTPSLLADHNPKSSPRLDRTNRYALGHGLAKWPVSSKILPAPASRPERRCAGRQYGHRSFPCLLHCAGAIPVFRCCLLAKHLGQPGHERLVGHVEPQRRDGNVVVCEGGDIAAVRRRHSPHAHIGDPVIGIAAAVLACVYLQPLLAVASLRSHRDALYIVGRAIRKIDVDQNVARNAGIEHAPDDARCEMDRSSPVRRLAAARLIGLRKRK